MGFPGKAHKNQLRTFSPFIVIVLIIAGIAVVALSIVEAVKIPMSTAEQRRISEKRMPATPGVLRRYSDYVVDNVKQLHKQPLEKPSVRHYQLQSVTQYRYTSSSQMAQGAGGYYDAGSR